MVKRLLILLAVLAAALPLSSAAAAPPAAPALQSAPCAVAAAAAIAQRGKDYVWGAKGPNAFDCSGLTSWAWSQAGYNIGPSTYDQARAGVAIPCNLGQLAGASTTCWQPGDLVFLRYSGGQHVAMYIGDGLFADAYNESAGVIIHQVQNDSFYQANFWQARRIVDCGDGVSVPVPSPDALPSSVPGLEELPDILDPLSFVVLQCGECNPDGTLILPATQWSEQWPQGFEALDLARVFRLVISWLAWQISEIIRQLICWLLSMLALLAGILESAVNGIIFGINSLFKLLVLLWLTFKAWFLAFWELLEQIRAALLGLSSGLAGLAEFGRLVLEVIALVLLVLGRLLVLVGQLGMVIIGFLGWLGGLAIGFFLTLQLALSGTVVPSQLASTHPFFYAVRGLGEGWRDSGIGWTLPVLWAMAWMAFIYWLAKFFSIGDGSK